MTAYQHPCFGEIQLSYFAAESDSSHHGCPRRPEAPPKRYRIDDMNMGSDREMPLAVAPQDITARNEIRLQTLAFDTELFL
jgi:hypothetical protein